MTTTTKSGTGTYYVVANLSSIFRNTYPSPNTES
jgi:hypothetical protein